MSHECNSCGVPLAGMDSVDGVCSACYRREEGRAIPRNPALAALRGAPVDMVLHCPACGMQHVVDAQEWVDDPHNIEQGRILAWKNESHRSHLCHGCGHIWRPADVPTNGVAAVKTKGKADAAKPAEPLLDDRVSPWRLAKAFGVKASAIMAALGDEGHSVTVNQALTKEQIARAVSKLAPAETREQPAADLRGIDAGSLEEWRDLSARGMLSKTAMLVQVSDLPKIIARALAAAPAHVEQPAPICNITVDHLSVDVYSHAHADQVHAMIDHCKGLGKQPARKGLTEAEQLVSMVIQDMDTCCGELGADYEFRELSHETVEAVKAYRGITDAAGETQAKEAP